MPSWCISLMKLMAAGLMLWTPGTWSQQSTDCPEDYRPCVCSDYGQGLEVSCDRVNASLVQDVFNRTTSSEIASLLLVLSSSDLVIPADLLVDKKVAVLRVSSAEKLNRVDPDAFRSSRDYTRELYVTSYPLKDWAFLEGFVRLQLLDVALSSNLDQSLATLPALPSLSELRLSRSSGLNQWVRFPVLLRGLNSFTLMDQLQQEVVSVSAMERILDWVSVSSADSLQRLVLTFNGLSSVPGSLGSGFRNLADLEMSVNNFGSIRSGSLPTFSRSPDYLDLKMSQVTSIQPGTFQGDYSRALVELGGNNLTRFESSVFETMLEQMSQISTTGSVSIYGNSFDCTNDPCHLSWLIRDNRALLSRVRDGRCSNGTLFVDLNADGLKDCPVEGGFTCTTDGVFANPDSCTSFYICYNGQALLQNCSAGLVFNPESKQCELAANAPPCPAGPFTCSADGVFANPQSCTSFYVCLAGEATLVECAQGLVFNPTTRKCDLPANVPTCSTRR